MGKQSEDRLARIPPHRQVCRNKEIPDEEDVALSAFDSFCRNAEAGRFPDLTDRDSLWRLLAEFTLRKAAHHVRDASALKRGGGKAPATGAGVFEEVLGREPDPALAAEVAEECERLLAALEGVVEHGFLGI